MLKPAWLLSLSLVFTSASGAADLGPLRVLSASGDPLRAEIEISAYTPEEASTLQVNLASADIYREAKVAYPEGLAGLSLRVADRPNGRKVVEVVSSGPVDAHVLDLLVEVTWNLGRYIRQYSFVLKSPPAEARAPVVNGAAVPPTLVRPGDTLFDLATRLRPEGATVFQTLLALFHANPQSFIDGNMNLLRAGSSLQVPLPAQVMAESDNQARQTLRTQNESFALYRERVAQAAAVATPIEAAPPANSGAGSIAAAPAEPAPVENTGDALKLSAQGTAATDASNPQAVRDRLEEEKAATQRAIDESESRVKELQSNITAMRGLLESQNQALSGMEQRANADAAAAAAAAAGGAVADSAATPADPAAAADPAATAADPATDPAADPAATSAPAADPAAADPAADAAAASAINEDTPTPSWANEKVIALFGGVLALLAVGLAVITLRRRARPNTRFDATESSREPGMAALPVMPADAALPASSAAAVAAGGAAAPVGTAASASAAAAAAAAAAYVASTSDDDEYGPLEDDGPLPENVAPIAPIAFGFDLDLDKPADASFASDSGSFAREPLAVLPLADMVYAPSPEATNDAAGFHVMPLHADLSANAQSAEGGYGPAVQRAAATAPVPDGATRDDLAEGFAKAAVLPTAAVDADAATPVAAPVSASVPVSVGDDMSAKSGAAAFDDATMNAPAVASVTADAAAASPEPAAAAPVMVQPESTSVNASSASAASGSAMGAAQTPASASDASTAASASSTSSAPAHAAAAAAPAHAAAAAAPVSVPAPAPVAKAAADLQAALAMTAGAASAAALAASAASANAGSSSAVSNAVPSDAAKAKAVTGSSAAPAVTPTTASTAASPVAPSLSSVTTPAVSPVIPAGDAPLEPPITPDTVSPGAPVMPVVTPPATPGLLPEPAPVPASTPAPTIAPTPAPVTAPAPATTPVPAAKSASTSVPTSTRVPGATPAAAAPAKPVPAPPKTVLSFDTGSSAGAPTASKFDLAKAYIDLGDRTAARELLNDIVKTGDTSQKHRARDMLATL